MGICCDEHTKGLIITIFIHNFNLRKISEKTSMPKSKVLEIIKKQSNYTIKRISGSGRKSLLNLYEMAILGKLKI